MRECNQRVDYGGWDYDLINLSIMQTLVLGDIIYLIIDTDRDGNDSVSNTTTLSIFKV